MVFIKIERREDGFEADGVELCFYEMASPGLCGRLLWTRSHKEKPKLAQMNSLCLLCGYYWLRISQGQGAHFTEECRVELSRSPKREGPILYLLRQALKKSQ